MKSWIFFLFFALVSFEGLTQTKLLYNQDGMQLSYTATYYNTVSIESINYFDQYEIKVHFANNTGKPLYYDGAIGQLASIEFPKDVILEKLLKKVAWRTDNGNYKYRYDDSIPRSRNHLAFGFPDGKQVRYDQPYPYKPNDMFPKADKIENVMLANQTDSCTIYILVAQNNSLPTPKWDVKTPIFKEKFKKENIKNIPENCGCFGFNKPRGKRGDKPKNILKTDVANNTKREGYGVVLPVKSILRSVEELKGLILKNLIENTSFYQGSEENSGGKSSFYFKNHLFNFDKENFYFEYEMANSYAAKTTDYKQYITPQILKTKIPIIGLTGAGKYQSNSQSPMKLSFYADGGITTQNEWKEYHGGQLRKTNPAGETDNCICGLIGYKFDADFKNFNELNSLIRELNRSFKDKNPAPVVTEKTIEELKQIVLSLLKTNTKNVTITYGTEASNTPGIVSFNNYQFAINGNILSFSVNYTTGDNSLKYWKSKTVHIESKINLATFLYVNDSFASGGDENIFSWEVYGQREAEKRGICVGLGIPNDPVNEYTIVNGKKASSLYTSIYGFDKGIGRANYVALQKALKELSNKLRTKK